MVSTAPKLRINREEKDIEIVKAQFAKLTKDHVEFVLQSMDDTSTKARNIRAVILTALYNSVNTINRLLREPLSFPSGRRNQKRNGGNGLRTENWEKNRDRMRNGFVSSICGRLF